MKMSKLFLTLISFSLISCATLSALIIETHNIQDITPYIGQRSLILFNIAEVITDSTVSLGSSPWRKYIKSQTRNYGDDLQNRVHDTLTLMIAQKIQHRPVEAITPTLIDSLQKQGIAVAALTSRGRSEWYTTEVPGIDDLTEQMLKSMGIDFSLSKLPFLSSIDPNEELLNHYRNGIFYSNHMDKGPFLLELLQASKYRPQNIIVIDDKRDSLESVERVMNELGLPFLGFWYRRTSLDRHDFSPMVAHVQMQQLLDGKRVTNDKETISIIAESYPETDHNEFFLDLLGQVGFD